MDVGTYTEIAVLFSNPLLRDIVLLIGAIVPIGTLAISWWGKLHSKDAANSAAIAAHAVTPNSGSSLADAVNRIEDRVTDIESRLEQHILTDLPCTHSDGSAG